MGFFRDVFGGGNRPDPLPPVATPATDALSEPLQSGLRGEGFDPEGENVSRRSRVMDLRRSFTGGQRSFKQLQNRTLSRDDTAAREVSTEMRERTLARGIENIKDEKAGVNFNQMLQAQDIGLSAAGNEQSTEQGLLRQRSNSKIRRIFSPDFDEGFVGGIGQGLGQAAGQGSFDFLAGGGIGQPGTESGTS